MDKTFKIPEDYNLPSEVKQFPINEKVQGVDYAATLLLSQKIEALRKRTWNMLHEEFSGMNQADVAMALGLVQYELIHHIGKQI